MQSLYDHAKHIVATGKPSVISKEKKHLSYVLVSNGYMQTSFFFAESHQNQETKH